MKVPDLSAGLYNFKQFSLLQTEKINNDTIQKGYDRYKRDWENKQNEEFINSCKLDAWFNEKYNPEILDLQEKERRELCKKNAEDFIEKTKAGFYDDIEFRIADVNKIGSVY